MKSIQILIWLALCLIQVQAQESIPSHWEINMEKAKEKAQAENKSILMVFAGSDWCKPCIQFKKDILLSDEFSKFEEQELIILYLDFPARKKNRLPENQTLHNEQLAEKFNRQGAFPKVVLLDGNGKKVKDIPFKNQSPSDYLHQFPKKSALSTERIFSPKKIIKMMGSRFEFTAVSKDEQQAWNAINAGMAEVERIERLISSWDPNSQTSLVNQHAGVKAVQVDEELFHLVQRSIKVSQLTDGAFDISYASMDKIWSFDGSMTEMPTQSRIDEARQYINWEHIILDETEYSIFLKEKGMKIGFGAIGKGYAANKAKQIMEMMNGIDGGVVNAGGDLISWGNHPKKDAWHIKIADPKDERRFIADLDVRDMAVVTSGDYERFVTFDGQRYAHIIDPRTGFPTTGIKSVTVICPDAEVADALATSVFVMGKEDGLAMVNQLNAIECLIVTDEDELISSHHLNLKYYE